MADNRSLETKGGAGTFVAPLLAYGPPRPLRYRPKIALIGCGGIAPYHLQAYQAMGLDVVALCDSDLRRAKKLAKAHYPGAACLREYRDVFAMKEVAVVDIATHPGIRATMIEDAIRSGKHVLSQKPFVTDLDRGEELVALAERTGALLAVNQNGRWAPHFSWMRTAVARGLVGRVMGAHFGVHWDHNWTATTPFNAVHHLILYDFAIHWFDMVACVMGRSKPRSVYATLTRAVNQVATPPLLAQVLVGYKQAQASLVFDASTVAGTWDTSLVVGSKGTLRSEGVGIHEQCVTLTTGRGTAVPALTGRWFDEGFQGTMGELLCAIEDGREPGNSARNNLASLALCFAAVRSAETGMPQVPGKVRRLVTE